MTKRNEADKGSLSFKDRTLSKAAARELFDAKAASVLGGIIDTTVVRVKHAKTTKAAKATEAYFAFSAPKNGRTQREASGKTLFARGTRLTAKASEVA